MGTSFQAELCQLEQVCNESSYLRGAAALSFSHQSDATGYVPTPSDVRYLTSIKSDRRKLHYLLGRRAASLAVKALTKQERSADIASSKDGYPCFPSNLTGSISHTEVNGESVAVSVAAATSHFLGIGVDAEYIQRKMNYDIREKVFTEREGLIYSSEPTSLIKVVSAKEAFYKAVYPLCHTYFGFHDAEVEISGSVFSATLCRELGANFPKGAKFNGTLFEHTSLVVSLVGIPAD